MFALISNQELQAQGKMLVKQLKNRYNDPTYNARFVVGVDRSKMRLYDCDQSSEQEEEDNGPAFDNSASGERLNMENKFRGFKI
jgi:hypothetical protein